MDSCYTQLIIQFMVYSHSQFCASKCVYWRPIYFWSYGIKDFKVRNTYFLLSVFSKLDWGSRLKTIMKSCVLPYYWQKHSQDMKVETIRANGKSRFLGRFFWEGLRKLNFLASVLSTGNQLSDIIVLIQINVFIFLRVFSLQVFSPEWIERLHPWQK